MCVADLVAAAEWDALSVGLCVGCGDAVSVALGVTDVANATASCEKAIHGDGEGCEQYKRRETSVQ